MLKIDNIIKKILHIAHLLCNKIRVVVKSVFKKVLRLLDFLHNKFKPLFNTICAISIEAKILLVFSPLIFIFFIFFIPSRITKVENTYSKAVYDKNGILLGATCAQDGQWRFEEGLGNEKFFTALILFEDKRFYIHNGIDFFAIIRALYQDIKQKKIVSGGSTITMQTVRILQKNPKRTILQKIKEAYIAFLFEMHYSKKQILKFYATNAPFGGNVVGLEAASWRYFGRSPKDLTWAEAATLAVLPNQPSLVTLAENRDVLLLKRNALLKTLFKWKKINNQTFLLSIEEPLPPSPFPIPRLAPHYLEYLKKQDNKTNKFYSTLDYSIQKPVQNTVELWSQKFSLMGINNAAALVLDTKTQDILAYIGNTGINGRNPKTKDVDIIHAKRSSGSLLKPFLYSAAMDEGILLNEQLIPDIPTRVGNYKPENNSRTYMGMVKASDALSKSLNIPAVRILQEYGINKFLDHLRNCGFTTFDKNAEYYGLPLILGGGEITMFECASCYARLMQRAMGIQNNFPCSVGSAYLIVEALSNGTRPEGEELWESFAHSKKIAWKTGTSNGHKDAWCIGVNENYTVAVWIGNAEGYGNEKLTSTLTAAPVMFDIFSILKDSKWPKIPYNNLEEIKLCAKSGFVATSECVETFFSYKPIGAPQTKNCPYCKIYSFTPDKKYLANIDDLTNEYSGTFPILESRFVLPPHLEYFYKKHNLGYKSLPPYVPWHESPNKENLIILFPTEGAKIIIPIEINGSYGSVVMEAAVRTEDTTLYWDIDGEFIGETNGIHSIKVSPNYGSHVLTVTDSVGTRRIRNFTVLDK